MLFYCIDIIMIEIMQNHDLASPLHKCVYGNIKSTQISLKIGLKIALDSPF